MPRYVVLRHEYPAGDSRTSHWDFMLEESDGLRTWALPECPDPEHPDAVEPMLARALPVHRAEYLQYEGPISGDRGHVTRWDEGTYTLERKTETELSITLSGKKFQGRVTLSRLADEPQGWRFEFSSD